MKTQSLLLPPMVAWTAQRWIKLRHAQTHRVQQPHAFAPVVKMVIADQAATLILIVVCTKYNTDVEVCGFIVTCSSVCAYPSDAHSHANEMRASAFCVDASPTHCRQIVLPSETTPVGPVSEC
jgi:hypothetical protein